MFVKRDFLQMNMCHLRYHTEIHYIAFVFYLIGELTFYLVIINEIYNLTNLYFEYLLYTALIQIMFQSPRLSNFSLIFLIFYQFLQYLVCKFKKHLFHFIYLFLYIFYTWNILSFFTFMLYIFSFTVPPLKFKELFHASFYFLVNFILNHSSFIHQYL